MSNAPAVRHRRSHILGRDAIAGATWALLTHPKQLALVQGGKAKWLDVFEEYARWIAPIGMSPRRVARPWSPMWRCPAFSCG